MKSSGVQIPDIRVLTPKKFADVRGFFSEIYNSGSLSTPKFVQDNLSHSARPGTVRGLHFQAPPFAQDKLVMVLLGSIFDVALDIRRNSPTYGQCTATTLSSADLTQLLVPKGFAHGYCTLEADTLVLYKVSNFYSAKHDCGVFWCDPCLGIEWPVEVSDAIVSERDKLLPPMKELRSPFTYDNA
jgi:dTDP-4-dehydrorhamnose 3,5-epimerase